MRRNLHAGFQVNDELDAVGAGQLSRGSHEVGNTAAPEHAYPRQVIFRWFRLAAKLITERGSNRLAEGEGAPVLTINVVAEEAQVYAGHAAIDEALDPA